MALGVDRLAHRAARDEVENEEVVAGLRRGEAEAGDDGLERGPHAVLARAGSGRRRIALVLRREKGRIDHHHRGDLVAEIMGEPSCDAPAERVSDDNRRPGLECAGLAPRLPRFADELAEIVSVAPIRAPHAAERRRDDAPFAGEERGDETPPVGVSGSAVQEDEAGLAALAPGEGLHLRAIDATNVRSGSIATTRSNHAGAGGFCPRKAASGAMGVDSGTRTLFKFRRLRTVPPRPCRRRRTSSRRHSARRASCPRSARGRSGARRSCHKGGRPKSRRRRR